MWLGSVSATSTVDTVTVAGCGETATAMARPLASPSEAATDTTVTTVTIATTDTGTNATESYEERANLYGWSAYFCAPFRFLLTTRTNSPFAALSGDLCHARFHPDWHGSRPPARPPSPHLLPPCEALQTRPSASVAPPRGDRATSTHASAQRRVRAPPHRLKSVKNFLSKRGHSPSNIRESRFRSAMGRTNVMSRISPDRKFIQQTSGAPSSMRGVFRSNASRVQLEEAQAPFFVPKGYCFAQDPQKD
jgi:hypothetical protein